MHRFYWPSIVIAYWLCGLWLLFAVAPISVDGGGPTATFYWGKHPPTPAITEYEDNLSVRLWFLVPYYCAATLMTCIACGLARWLVRLWQPRRSYIFLVATVTTLVSLLAAGGISDIGTSLHFWRGPRMYSGVSYMWPFLEILIPMSLLAGFVSLLRIPRPRE
jgi:hypothetical protein